jgi:hypothetical protein
VPLGLVPNLRPLAIGSLASGTLGTPRAKVAAAESPLAPGNDSPQAPAGMTAALVAEEDEDSADSFHWDRDEDGVMYEDARKPKALVFIYTSSPPAPSCCRVSIKSALANPTCSATQSVDNILLPPILVQSLLKAIPTMSGGAPFRLVVADTSATDHMVPDCGAFISYKSVSGLRVQMGNKSFAPVLGHGTAIISLNGQRHLICNVLHVPGLRVPLYSPRAHLHQLGCVFLGVTRLACMFTSLAWS